MSEQIYEKYWKITLAYTNIHGEKFNNTLKAIVEFIDKKKFMKINQNYYDDLQNYVSLYNGLEGTSLRKSINQFVKLGFVNNLQSYNSETIDFLNARTNRKRQSIFSKVVYKYSSFNSSITNPLQYSREINFLLKTLEEVGNLSEENIIGLMLVNINSIPRGYLTKEEVLSTTKYANNIGFIKRKYNQISYLTNLLKKLDDIVFVDNFLYFEEDAKIIFGDNLNKDTRKRDNYLHRIYKNLLKEEVEEKLNFTQCMVERLAYPSLVASHIKPFINSNDFEAYDPNNGLLLSRNFDILFDQGYITFDDFGNIIYSLKLRQDVINHIYSYKLNSLFINEKRLQYLNYHRNVIFKH